MTIKSDLADDRIPLIEVSCSNCGAKILVPKCIDFDIIICPCCGKETKP